MCVCLHVYTFTMCMHCPCRLEEGIGIPRTRVKVIGSCPV